MDVTIGQAANREMAVTADMVAKYVEITGFHDPDMLPAESPGASAPSPVTAASN